MGRLRVVFIIELSVSLYIHRPLLSLSSRVATSSTTVFDRIKVLSAVEHIYGLALSSEDTIKPSSESMPCPFSLLVGVPAASPD